MKSKKIEKRTDRGFSGKTFRLFLATALVSIILAPEVAAMKNTFQQSTAIQSERVGIVNAANQKPETPQTPAQSPAADDRVFTVVEHPPVFPGGFEALHQFLMENIRYPKQAMLEGIQGTVFVTFIVEKDGSITNVQVLRGLGEAIDAEAKRVTKSMPRWIPGTQRGEPKRVQFNMPISFRLN